MNEEQKRGNENDTKEEEQKVSENKDTTITVKRESKTRKWNKKTKTKDEGKTNMHQKTSKTSEAKRKKHNQRTDKETEDDNNESLSCRSAPLNTTPRAREDRCAPSHR